MGLYCPKVSSYCSLVDRNNGDVSMSLESGSSLDEMYLYLLQPKLKV